MKKVVLGQTGIEVTELSFGTLTLGRLQANMTPEEGVPALQKAVEMGINFYDTAQAYGTQNHLRVGLGSARHDVLIATKTHAKTPGDAQKTLEESLRELGRDHIDLYHLHLINNAEDMANRRAVVDYFLECKEKGLLRAIGASVHKVEAAKVVADEPGIDVLFPIINSQGLGILDGSVGDMIEVCKTAKANGKGIYAMKPLGGGHLRRSPQEAYRFIQDLGIVDSICVGMKSAPEVEMNVSIFEEREVSQDVLDQVETVERSLKIYDFACTGCGSCVETCDQGALSLQYPDGDESEEKKGVAVVDKAKCILCGYCAEACPRFALRVV